MSRRSLLVSAALAAVLVFATPRSLFAQPISVGTGPDMAQVYFNWPDGFAVVYDVSFGTGPSSTIDVYDLTEDCTADPNLSLTWINYGSMADPNYFLNIASYTGGHIGDGDTYNYETAPNNYWAEWVGAPWTYGDGASEDTVSNGGQAGWVFGSPNTPVPEPTCAAALLIGGGALLMRRHRAVKIQSA
jgi:hypothetical protein